MNASEHRVNRPKPTSKFFFLFLEAFGGSGIVEFGSKPFVALGSRKCRSLHLRGKKRPWFLQKSTRKALMAHQQKPRVANPVIAYLLEGLAVEASEQGHERLANSYRKVRECYT